MESFLVNSSEDANFDSSVALIFFRESFIAYFCWLSIKHARLLLAHFTFHLACPARFERATYSLEKFVTAGIFIFFNGLQHKNGTT